MADRSEWSERVSEWRASGKTAREFCAERGLKIHSLRWWASQLSKKASSEKAPVRMARVERKAARPHAAITVEIAGARVLVQADSDPSTLKLVIEALSCMASAR